jgi:MoxR-like ATPase
MHMPSNIDILRACYAARVHCLLIGRPGIGKSFLAAQVAARLQDPTGAGTVLSVVCPEDTPVAELRGHYLPSGQGTWSWHDGPLTAAFRNGYPVIVDELSHLSPEAVTFMHAALDRSDVTLPSGETVSKHANFWCIATQNDSEDCLRGALRDRFPVRVTVANPMPEAYSGLSSELQAHARAQVEGDPTSSLRPWYAFDALRCVLDESVAAELTFPGRGEELVTAIELAGK